jgi:hypothetical protein
MASPDHLVQQLSQALAHVQDEVLKSSRTLQNLAQTCRQATRAVPANSTHQFVTNFPLNEMKGTSGRICTSTPFWPLSECHIAEERASRSSNAVESEDGPARLLLHGNGLPVGNSTQQSQGSARPLAGGVAKAYGCGQGPCNCPDDAFFGFTVQNPSDACMDILAHEGMVRLTLAKEAMSETADRQR